MSFLLLKAPDCDPSKETISATHKGVIGLRGLEGGSFGSGSGQTNEPVCTLHGGSREGQNLLKQYASDLKEPRVGILEFDNEQQQWKTESEMGQVRTENACVEEERVLKQSFEDGLVCKVVSPFCFLPESSTASPHQLERELKGLSLQDTQLDASVSCSEGDGSKVVSPPPSLEGSSAFAGKCEGLLLSQGLGEVAPSSIERNVGLTKLKSSLRGGYEKAGLGPRPKGHVMWAPNVYDPPCTSSSHTISSPNHRRHHHSKSEHKNRHKGKGSSHLDSHKKSQKKGSRKLKHASENFVSCQTVVSQQGIWNNTRMLKEYSAPLQDLGWKSARVSPFIVPPKGCFLNPVLPFGEKDLVTFEMIQGCRARHVQPQKLCL